MEANLRTCFHCHQYSEPQRVPIDWVPGFVAVVWFGSFPFPIPPLFLQQARPAANRKTEKDNLLTGKGAKGGGRGAKSCDCKKAWSSINHSLLSGVPRVRYLFLIITDKISRCSSATRKIFVLFWNVAKTSVVDPWHFGVDPDPNLDPRIHVSD